MLWCNVKIKETNAYLNFSFDASLISFIKKYCKTRSYDATTKTWKIAIPEYNQLKYVFQNTYSFNEMVEEVENVDVNNFKEHFDAKDIPLKLTLTDEQIKCVDWHINLPKSLNGCTMGLGKTAVAIATALWRKKHNNIKHCLIICGVSGNKYNWNDIEILKTCDEVPFLIDGTGEERYKQFENLPDNFFIICNIETLRLKTNNPIINIIKKQVDSGNIEMIVGDEFHKCFLYDSLIDTDLGAIKIGAIVENKIKCKVLSYNHKTKKYEYKNILNYYKNSIQNDLIELEILDENGAIHKIKCTKNHKIYTENRGYVEADLLNENDKIFIKEMYNICQGN